MHATLSMIRSTVSKRRHKQMELISALLAGLVTAIDYTQGQELLEEREFVQHEALFQDLFEIGRRHKIMNPGKPYTAVM
jgi:Protein of unknown function (DUF2009)